MLKYKVEYRGVFTFVKGGIALDAEIKWCVNRGWNLEDIRITVEVVVE